jgi:hypothetical protein
MTAARLTLGIVRRHRLTGLCALATLAVSAGGLIQVPGASAQGAVFSITPAKREPYFIFHTSPGGVLSGQVRIVNVSATAGQVALYPVDATTGQTSGAVYLSAQAQRRGVGRWVSLSTSTLTLAAHQRRVVSFSLRVPPGTSAGQHLGGLVAAPLKPQSTQATSRGRSTFHVNIQEISIVAVQVNLPGPARQQMTISDLVASGRPGYQTLLIGLGNTGNTLVKGAGRLTVSRAGGGRVLERSFPLDTFVPQTRIAFPVYVRGPRLPVGSYVATVVITYGNGHRVSRTFHFAISAHQVRQTFGTTGTSDTTRASSPGASVPVWVLVLGAVLLVGGSVGGSSLYFRRRTAGT